ncbi:MAG: hypothetical protein ACREUN_15715 [Burkholderiales bacterium]
MELTDAISVLIFALILMAVAVYIVMSRYVIGPLVQLKPAERVMLAIMLVGVGLVMAYAAAELLLHVVF